MKMATESMRRTTEELLMQDQAFRCVDEYRVVGRKVVHYRISMNAYVMTLGSKEGLRHSTKKHTARKGT